VTVAVDDVNVAVYMQLLRDDYRLISLCGPVFLCMQVATVISLGGAGSVHICGRNQTPSGSRLDRLVGDCCMRLGEVGASTASAYLRFVENI
jgi:hypothetical protein